MFWMYIYLHFREGSCHVTEATLIKFQNRTYAERSTVPSHLHPRFCSSLCFLSKIFPCWTASFLLKKLCYSVSVSHLGRQASLVTYKNIIGVIKPKIISHVSPILGSAGRGSSKKLECIKHRSFSCFLAWRSYRVSKSVCHFSSYKGCNTTIQIKHFHSIRFCFSYK